MVPLLSTLNDPQAVAASMGTSNHHGGNASTEIEKAKLKWKKNEVGKLNIEKIDIEEASHPLVTLFFATGMMPILGMMGKYVFKGSGESSGFDDLMEHVGIGRSYASFSEIRKNGIKAWKKPRNFKADFYKKTADFAKDLFKFFRSIAQGVNFITTPLSMANPKDLFMSSVKQASKQTNTLLKMGICVLDLGVVGSKICGGDYTIVEEELQAIEHELSVPFCSNMVVCTFSECVSKDRYAQVAADIVAIVAFILPAIMDSASFLSTYSYEITIALGVALLITAAAKAYLGAVKRKCERDYTQDKLDEVFSPQKSA